MNFIPNLSYSHPRSRTFSAWAVALLGSATLLMAGFPSNTSSTSNTSTPSNSTNTATSSPASSTVRLGSFFTAVDYGPYLVAKDKKWFEEALQPLGAKPTYTIFQALPALNETMATNQVDVVFEAEPPAIVGKAAGITVKITGISCRLTQQILVPKNGPGDIKGLKGKKIAVLAGTSSHYGVIKILEKAGLQKSDVEIIDMPPPEAKAAFETGKVDAWAVWPPFVEQEELSGKGKALGGGTAGVNSIMAMRGDFLTQQPKLAQAVFNTLARAKTWIQQNPAEAQKIVSRQLKVPLPVVQKAWSSHDWKAQLDGGLVKDVQAKADFLLNAKFIKKPVQVQGDLVDDSLQKAAS